MVHSCSVECTNRWSKDTSIKFHQLPLKKPPDICLKWIVATRCEKSVLKFQPKERKRKAPSNRFVTEPD